ncbi:MAG: tRNA (adenosine(37)-N6)-threonylcarbamoyltransferase complex transferase subunit TsaD [Candidatus Aminicenantales bacterium]
MRTLAIETSCDETAAAVLGDDRAVLSNIVLSQDEIHAPYGGVVPELASRQHLRSIDYIVRESLRCAEVQLGQIDLFAATQGPGLIGSLLVGLSFAKALAYYYGRPLIGVDHVQAHIEAAFLEHKDIPFPVLALVVSGGHTSLYFQEKKLHYVLVGKTRDDAAGEALDKIAKFLELGYPGGPVIEKLGIEGNPRRFEFTLPRMTDRSLDFSFSGLKTAALRIIKEENVSKSDSRLSDFLAGFEAAVIRALLENLGRAMERFRPKSLILCGGVARNMRLRDGFAGLAEAHQLNSFIPSPKLCTDNAAMVGALALERVRGQKGSALALDLDAYPRMNSS